MFTVIGLFKRRPGMSMEDFQKHYEGVHAPLGAKYMANIIDYKRRYLTPMPYPLDGKTLEAEYDVITEMSFQDKASADASEGSDPDEQRGVDEDIIDADFEDLGNNKRK